MYTEAQQAILLTCILSGLSHSSLFAITHWRGGSTSRSQYVFCRQGSTVRWGQRCRAGSSSTRSRSVVVHPHARWACRSP